jgi:hypothetical protein
VPKDRRRLCEDRDTLLHIALKFERRDVLEWLKNVGSPPLDTSILNENSKSARDCNPGLYDEYFSHRANPVPVATPVSVPRPPTPPTALSPEVATRTVRRLVAWHIIH